MQVELPPIGAAWEVWRGHELLMATAVWTGQGEDPFFLVEEDDFGRRLHDFLSDIRRTFPRDPWLPILAQLFPEVAAGEVREAPRRQFADYRRAARGEHGGVRRELAARRLEGWALEWARRSNGRARSSGPSLVGSIEGLVEATRSGALAWEPLETGHAARCVVDGERTWIWAVPWTSRHYEPALALAWVGAESRVEEHAAAAAEPLVQAIARRGIGARIRGWFTNPPDPRATFAMLDPSWSLSLPSDAVSWWSERRKSLGLEAPDTRPMADPSAPAERAGKKERKRRELLRRPILVGDDTQRFARVKRALTSGDPALVARAIEALARADGSAIFDKLLDGMRRRRREVLGDGFFPNGFLCHRRELLSSVALAAPAGHALADLVRRELVEVRLEGGGWRSLALSRAPRLEALTLARTRLDRDGWDALRELPLRSLRLEEVELAPGLCLEGASSIHRLELDRVSGLASTGDRIRLPALGTLRVSGLDASVLDDLSGCTGLSRLRLSDLAGSAPRALRALPNIEALAIVACNGIVDLAFLAEAPRSLTSLHLGRLGSLSSLAGIRGTRIELLCLQDNALKELDELPPGLRELHIERGVVRLTAVATCPRLKMMSVTEAPIRDLSPLAGARALVRLRIDDCKDLSDVSPISGLPCLEIIELPNCASVADTSPLYEAPKLREFRLKGTAAHPNRGRSFEYTPLYWEGPPDFRYTRHDDW